jgi:hypothetical protein
MTGETRGGCWCDAVGARTIRLRTRRAGERRAPAKECAVVNDAWPETRWYRDREPVKERQTSLSICLRVLFCSIRPTSNVQRLSPAQHLVAGGGEKAADQADRSRVNQSIEFHARHDTTEGDKNTTPIEGKENRKYRKRGRDSPWDVSMADASRGGGGREY